MCQSPHTPHPLTPDMCVYIRIQITGIKNERGITTDPISVRRESKGIPQTTLHTHNLFVFIHCL